MVIDILARNFKQLVTSAYGAGFTMGNLESEPQGNPFIEMAVKAIADWVSKYRNAIGFDELGMCGPDEVMRMAEEIGVTPSQLHELASKGTGNPNLLKSMLLALHVDPEVLADMDPLIARELKWLCITCGNKQRCKHELAKGTAAEHFREFCPNAVSLDELLDQGPHRAYCERA
jgi:hypothetical protein